MLLGLEPDEWAVIEELYAEERDPRLLPENTDTQPFKRKMALRKWALKIGLIDGR